MIGSPAAFQADLCRLLSPARYLATPETLCWSMRLLSRINPETIVSSLTSTSWAMQYSRTRNAATKSHINGCWHLVASVLISGVGRA
jgi:hypothetical protein